MGGAERSLYELIQAFPALRAGLCVCLPDKSTLFNLLRKDGIAVFPLPPFSLKRSKNPLTLAKQFASLRHASRALADLCTELQIDVMHANTDSAALAAWGATRIATRKTPFVWHCRDIRPLGRIGRMMPGAAASVVAISSAVEKHLLAERVCPEKIRTIHNGIDLARIRIGNADSVRARVRKSLGISAKQPVLLCVGGYVPWKRHDLFMRTLAALKTQFPTLTGVIAGSDQFNRNHAHVAELKTLARALCLPDGMLLELGERDDIPALMAAADVLVSCSENEPFGRVLVEAGAAGLPVVSAASGGKIEIVEHGVTGLLVEPGHADLMADACRDLVLDPGLRKTMGRNAVLRTAQLFDVRRAAKELFSLLENAARANSENR